MKTLKRINFTIIAFAIVACFFITSCEKDDDDNLSSENTTENLLDSDVSTSTIGDSVAINLVENANLKSGITIINGGIVTTGNAIKGTGNIITKTSKGVTFSEVELRTIGNVEIKKGSEYKIEVTDYENLFPYMRIGTKGERLIISFANNVSIVNSKLKVVITMPDKLKKCINSSVGNMSILSNFASIVELTASGAGNIYANSKIASDNLTLTLSGVGSIDATGTANKLIVNVTGNGKVNCTNLVGNNVECNVGGISAVYIGAKTSLKVYATGIGSLIYYGNPAVNIVKKGMMFTVKKGV